MDSKSAPSNQSRTKFVNCFDIDDFLDNFEKKKKLSENTETTYNSPEQSNKDFRLPLKMNVYKLTLYNRN